MKTPSLRTPAHRTSSLHTATPATPAAHAAPRATAAPRRAFSLVFSLIIMSLMLMLVLCLVALLTVEMRLSANAVDRQRARFNALAGAKHALAQLQQEAGPDQRVTAQSNVTLSLGAKSSTPSKRNVRTLWKDRNAYWTGVWDTRTSIKGKTYDPSYERPAAWLVSGPVQLQSLAELTEYPSDYKVPWTKIKSDDKESVILFTSLPATEDPGTANADADSAHPFDTKVTVSRVDILSPAGNTVGHLAYWVGDEGVKARVNLQLDTYHKKQEVYSAYGFARSLTPPRLATELIPNWDNFQSDDLSIVNVLNTSSYAAHPSLEKITTTAAATETGYNVANSYAHAVTAYSQGLQTDTRFGGLKWDLSLAFEMPIENWYDSPFGVNPVGGGGGVPALPSSDGRSNGMATLDMESKESSISSPGSLSTNNAAPTGLGYPIKMQFSKDTKPMLLVREVGGAVGGDRVWSRPVFSTTLSGEQSAKANNPAAYAEGKKRIRGPAWELMRNYYRLYKAMDDDWKGIPNDSKAGANNFYGGALRARTFYPGIKQHNGQKASNGTHEAISHIFNSQNSGGDPFADDIAVTNGGLRPVPRPIKIAVSAYMTRYVLAFGLKREATGAAEGKTRVHLTVTPCVAVRNPYNVPISICGDIPINGTYNPKGTQEVGMKFGLRRYASPTFTFTTGQTSYGPYAFQEILRANMTNWNESETFVILAPYVVIPPGETYIFSAAGEKMVDVSGAHAIVGELGFNNQGGFFIPKIVNTGGGFAPLEVDEGEALTVNVGYNPSGSSYDSGTFIRFHIKSWPGDNGAYWHKDSYGTFSECAEHSEPFMIQFNPAIASPDRAFPFSRQLSVSTLPSEGGGALPLAILEFLEKPADWKPGYQYGGGKNAFPLYLMSNPLTATQRPDGQGRWTGPADKKLGFGSSSVSWHFRVRPCFAYEEMMAQDGYAAYGGNSIFTDGQRSFVTAYVPRTPMISLGEFQTANISVADHQPLYSVGNSFPTPFVGEGYVYHSQGSAHWTNYDHTWLLNNALWDRFFYSSIAPVTDPRGRDVPREVRSQKDVWSSFISTDPQSYIPLPNPQFILNPTIERATLQRLIDDKDSYRRSAAYLYQNGAFNINALDERAWTALLASNRNGQVAKSDNGNTAGNDGGRGSADDNITILPRLLPIQKNDQGGSSISRNSQLRDHAAWRGAKGLTDKQIKLLAQAVVYKSRQRVSTSIHGVKYTHADVPSSNPLRRPFLSIAEFVNHAVFADNEENRPTSSPTDFHKFGVIQAAIFYADKILKAEINVGMEQDTVDIDRNKLLQTDQGSFPFPNVVSNMENAKLAVSGASVGNLVQGDIFQSVGARLSARSDTFTIRAYGDTVGEGGNNLAGRAWCELVVQRTPEYVDPTDAPETNPHDDMNFGNINTTGKEKNALSVINKYLGRRFRIVSIRWLNESDL
ncbi:MAG: hypothetical protein LBT53_04245 [Puniceicoccales bacterium]|jgi:hypothetical protein|nr:hypothetical protein [Puniceicoccales bacterium]